MYGRQDQVILVKQRIAGKIACGCGWVERKLGEESFPRRIAAGNLLELFQVGLTGFDTVIESFQVRLLPATRFGQLQLPGVVGEFGR